MFAKAAIFILGLAAFANATLYPGTSHPLSVISPAYVSHSCQLGGPSHRCRYSCEGLPSARTVLQIRLQTRLQSRRRSLAGAGSKNNVSTGRNLRLLLPQSRRTRHLRTQIHTRIQTHLRTQIQTLWLTLLWSSRVRGAELSIVAQQRFRGLEPRRMVVEQLGSVRAVLGHF